MWLPTELLLLPPPPPLLLVFERAAAMLSLLFPAGADRSTIVGSKLPLRKSGAAADEFIICVQYIILLR